MALNDRVDFPALRRSFTKQIAEEYLKLTGTKPPLKALAKRFALSVADPVIARLITIRGLLDLLGKGNAGKNANVPLERAPFGSGSLDSLWHVWLDTDYRGREFYVYLPPKKWNPVSTGPQRRLQIRVRSSVTARRLPGFDPLPVCMQSARWRSARRRPLRAIRARKPNLAHCWLKGCAFPKPVRDIMLRQPGWFCEADLEPMGHYTSTTPPGRFSTEAETRAEFLEFRKSSKQIVMGPVSCRPPNIARRRTEPTPSAANSSMAAAAGPSPTCQSRGGPSVVEFALLGLLFLLAQSLDSSCGIS